MANKVKIYNLNTHPLKEIFKGNEVLIEAQDYWRDKKGNIREFDIYEANDFRGQYHPVESDGSGKNTNDPKHFKMLRMDPVGDASPIVETEPSGFKCMAAGCKHVSPSPEELEAHAKVRHADIETLILPEEDQRMRQQKSVKQK